MYYLGAQRDVVHVASSEGERVGACFVAALSARDDARLHEVDRDACCTGSELGHERIGDLLAEIFLQAEAPREAVHQPTDGTEPDHSIAG